MNPTVIPSSALLLMLVDTLAGEWAAPTVSLFTNDVNPGKGAVIGDFTLATFVGSAPLPITTWGEAFLNDDLDAAAVGTLLQFDYDSGTPEIAYGIVVKSASIGTPLLAYARLEVPKEFATTSDSLAIVPKFVMSAAGFGSFVTVAP